MNIFIYIYIYIYEYMYMYHKCTTDAVLSCMCLRHLPTTCGLKVNFWHVIRLKSQLLTGRARPPLNGKFSKSPSLSGWLS